jgi:hypothetical protein
MTSRGGSAAVVGGPERLVRSGSQEALPHAGGDWLSATGVPGRPGRSASGLLRWLVAEQLFLSNELHDAGWHQRLPRRIAPFGAWRAPRGFRIEDFLQRGDPDRYPDRLLGVAGEIIDEAKIPAKIL